MAVVSQDRFHSYHNVHGKRRSIGGLIKWLDITLKVGSFKTHRNYIFIGPDFPGL